MPTRCILRVKVLPEARAGVTKTTTTFGMTQVAVLSRLFEWLAQQPDLVQGSILQQLPKDFQPDILEKILQQMAMEKNQIGRLK